MAEILTVLIGFIGCGGLAAIAYFISSHFANKSNILEAVHQVRQKIGIKKVKEIEEKEKVIVSVLREHEALSEESKEKIEVIKDEANEEIKKIIYKENFVELEKEEDELW